jgi:uncharacterized RDD family membrane protein YckC
VKAVATPPLTAAPAATDRAAFAGLATRVLAFALDALIINAVILFVGVVCALGLSLIDFPSVFDKILVAIGGVIALAWTAGYFVVFWSTTGQTPGNRVFEIRVQSGSRAAPPRAAVALLRFALLPISALPLFAGFLLILFDDRRRALHDRLVGTVVVYAPSARARR